MKEQSIEKINVALNWSSGKDAALTYLLLQRDARYRVSCLLTTVNEEHERVVMHGIRQELLEAQALQAGIALKKILIPIRQDDAAYKQAMEQAWIELKQEGIDTAAFGDIFLEDLKIYREEQLTKIGVQGIFPLWKKNTAELVSVIEDEGIEAMIVCVNEKFLGKEFLGRKIDRAFLNDLPANVDPCGENGEFHTYVYNAPYFKEPVAVEKGEIVFKEYLAAKDDKDKWNTGFYFLDLHLKK